MNIVRDIQPISNLKRNTAALLKQLEETGEPVILTRNGQPKVVIQDAAAYQAFLDAKEYWETVASIHRGIEDFEQGRSQPAEEVFAELRELYGLQD